MVIKIKTEEEIRKKLEDAHNAKTKPTCDRDYFDGPVYSGVIQALEWVLGMMDDDL
jgi:hypothetical protein